MGRFDDGAMRILIADEEPLAALTVAEILTLCGHHVIGPAFGAEEARRLSRSQPPTLALIAVDFDSPDAGLALGRELSEKYSTAVILTTSDPNLVGSCTWALGVLSQPYDPDDAAVAVSVAEAVLSGSTPFPHHVPGAFQLFARNSHSGVRAREARNDGGRTAPILLVEDHPKQVELAIESLRENRVENEVVVARDGDEAIACLEQRKIADPALILLDINMPSCDGLEVLRRLKSRPRWRRIPVVVFSAANDESIVRSCYEHGVNAYVIKPADHAHFAKSVALVGRFWTRRNKRASESQLHG